MSGNLPAAVHPNCGQRRDQAVMAAAATMYFNGISTHDVEDVLEVIGIEGMSAIQVSSISHMSKLTDMGLYYLFIQDGQTQILHLV